MTDETDHGQGNSPMILNAERILSVTEFERWGGSVGTRIVIDGPENQSVYFAQETIYVVVEKLMEGLT